MDEDTARILKQMAKEAGIPDESVNGYISETPIVEKQTPELPKSLDLVSQTPSSQVPELPTSMLNTPTPQIPKIPNVVEPFRSPETTNITQGFGQRGRYNPSGHVGLDLTNPNRAVTNPIGGINVSGYQPGGYGNYNAVVGASPEELAQMDPKQIELIRQAVKSRIAGGAESLNSINIPGKNIEIQGHLAMPAPDVSTVATGSADLRMGSTGRSTGPHLHQEFKDTTGQEQDIRKVLSKLIYK